MTNKRNADHQKAYRDRKKVQLEQLREEVKQERNQKRIMTRILEVVTCDRRQLLEANGKLAKKLELSMEVLDGYVSESLSKTV